MRIAKAPIPLSAILVLAVVFVVCMKSEGDKLKRPTVAMQNREKLETLMKRLRVGMTEEEENEVLFALPCRAWASDGGAQTGTVAFQKAFVEPGPVLCLFYKPSDSGSRLASWEIKNWAGYGEIARF